MIKGTNHIGVVVVNIEEAIHLYTNAFGFHLAQPVTMVPDLGIKDAFVSSGEVTLELIEPVDSEKAIGKFLKKHGEGLHHISLNVDDINETLRSLAQKGVSLINEEPFSYGGVLIAAVHPRSTRGVLIELLQSIKTEER